MEFTPYQGVRSDYFKQPRIVNCTFYQDNLMFITYVDNGIFTYSICTKIYQLIRDISEFFDIEDQGTFEYYIIVNIKEMKNVKLQLSKPHLIDRIVEGINMSRRASSRSIPEK